MHLHVSLSSLIDGMLLNLFFQIPDTPCREYLPTFGLNLCMVNVGKYSIHSAHMGMSSLCKSIPFYTEIPIGHSQHPPSLSAPTFTKEIPQANLLAVGMTNGYIASQHDWC